MKKLSLLFTFLIMVSCNNTAVQKVADSITPDAEIVEVEVNNPAGYLSQPMVKLMPSMEILKI